MISLPLILGALWVIVGAITATLPMRLQRYPGIPLLIAAPVLLIWIGWKHGFVWVTIGLFAFLSMFRRPLNYFIRWGLGLQLPNLPPELRRDATRDPPSRGTDA
ncbi:MAG: DUF2484 family protein [Alphaproteobacteria bacterium]